MSMTVHVKRLITRDVGQTDIVDSYARPTFQVLSELRSAIRLRFKTINRSRWKQLQSCDRELANICSDIN